MKKLNKRQSKPKKKKRIWYFYDIPPAKEIFLVLYIFVIHAAFYILINSITEFVWPTVSFFFLCFCAWRFHTVKLKNSQNLYKKVAWIAEREPNGRYSGRAVSLRGFELFEYIEFEQRKQNLPQEYQIDFSNETEKDNLIKILDSHKEHVFESYFCDWLAKSEYIYNLTQLEYYFFSLHCYLQEGCNALYCNREYISEHKYKCQLTDCGRIHYKLRLVTQLYIENNEQIQKLCDYIDKKRKSYIIEILEKNEVVFLSYRP